MSNLEILSRNADPNKGKRKYITYIAPDLDNVGKIYVGRSSGHGTPQQILNRRKAGHHRNLGDLELDQVTESYATIRGREHLVWEKLRKQGLATDQLNPISPRNKKKEHYIRSAIEAFGEP